ncbi:aminotransferase class V-fold PLP-dependent enzyme [Micromonospora echinospora]
MPTLLTTFRDRFPALADTVHLAACSIAARSTDLDQALTAMLDDLSRPIFWAAGEEHLLQARRRFAHLIGADTDQIAILPNASVAAYQAAAGLRWRRRRHLLTTPAEFPGIAHVWLAQRDRGAQVRWCGTSAGRVTTADYLNGITARTGLVSVPAVTYRDATRLNIARIADAAHAAGAKVFVDAYQAVGVMPVDVDALRCDYLVAGAGKYLLGLPGLAFLYARDPQGPAPTLTGRFGRVDPYAFDTTILDFPPHARRFETGTPSVAAVYAAVAGLSLIERLDLGAVRHHTQSLVSDAATRLAGQGEIVLLGGNADEQGAHLALVEPHAEAMAAWLAHRNIIVAPRAGVVRLAMHAYTTGEDVDAACEGIAAYRVGSRTRQRVGAAR